ncbi:MAG: glycerate kinase [Actinomycetota bacterium]
MRVLFAPDSFKGSITAADAAAALARGWRSARDSDEIDRVPLADGGEGTLDVLAAAVPGARWHPATVTGPAGAPVSSAWLELPGGAAVIELARASGLPMLSRLDPLGAQTTGTGELIGLALDGGATAVSLAIGGSASTDGGTGALTALGASFLDGEGAVLPSGGGGLRRLASADLSGLRPAPLGGVRCLTDVTAPLLGPLGAAAAFGPQKGAGPEQIAELESGLAQLARVLGGDPEAPGAGAAGGTGYGFAAAWGAVVVPGAAELGQIAGLPAAIARADLVVTGEGRYDQTSGTGKVTGTVLAAAAAAGVPSAVVAGCIAAELPAGCEAGISLTTLAGGEARAQQAAAHWLEAAGRALAALSLGKLQDDGPDRTCGPGRTAELGGECDSRTWGHSP